MPQNGQGSELNALSEKLIGEHWDFYPTAGSRIGRHEYDGKLPDLSTSQVRRREQEIRRAARSGALDPLS